MLTKSDLCKATGITAETLRHYLNLGLIAPADRTESGYNLYSEINILKILNIRYYRGLEIPLPDISDVVTHIPPSEYVNWLESRYARMRRDVELRTHLLEYFKYHIGTVDAFLGEKDEVPFIATNEGVTRSAYYDGTPDSAERVRKLSTMFPYSFVSTRVFREPIDESTQFDVGVSLPEYYIDPGEFEDGDSYLLSPATRVYMFKRIPDMRKICIDDFKLLLDYTEEHRFKIIGDVMCAVVIAQQVGEQVDCLVQACVCIDA